MIGFAIVFEFVKARLHMKRSCGRVYSGRLAQFGQGKKGDPKRLPAIWLGKTLSDDRHALCDRGVILVSRSIRRLPHGFSLEMLGQVESAPWEHGLTSLGHKLFQTKRYQGPDDPPFGDEVVKESPDVLRESTELSCETAVEVQDGQGGSDGVPSKAGMKPPPANAAVAGDVEMHGPSQSAPSHVGVPSTSVIHVDREELELEAST